MKKDLGYVKGPKGDTGPQGAVGPQGAKGEKGDPARVCGKLAGADGNIQLVAADVGGLSAEQINALLLNKANVTPTEISGQDIIAVAKAGKSGWYFGLDCTNAPRDGYWRYEIITYNIPGHATVKAYPFYGNVAEYIRGINDTTDGVWTLQATATPPEEHALPLVEGWTAGRKTKFSVSQDSLVLVTFGVWGPANMSDRAVIAQLPPGFRPGELISTGCTVTDESTYTRYAAGLDVNRAGEVIVFSKQPGWSIAVGQVAFYVSA